MWGHYSTIGYPDFNERETMNLWKDTIEDPSTEFVSENPPVALLKHSSGMEMWSAINGNECLGFEPHFCSGASRHVSVAVEEIDLDHSGLEANIQGRTSNGFLLSLVAQTMPYSKKKWR